MQLTTSVDGWVISPKQPRTMSHIFTCWPDDGQVKGDNTYAQLLSVQVEMGGVYIHAREVIEVPPVQPKG